MLDVFEDEGQKEIQLDITLTVLTEGQLVNATQVYHLMTQMMKQFFYGL